MHINQWMIYVALGSALGTSPIYSANVQNHEQLQVPQCLAKEITFKHQVLSENKQFKVIELASTDINTLALLADKVHCGRFVNVSHQVSTKKQAVQMLQKKATSAPLLKHNFVYDLKHQQEVKAAINTLNADNIWQTLTHLTSYHNRSATKDTGVEAANWLKSTFENMAKESGRTDTATYFVDTGDYYKQPSLVTVIGKDINAPGIVIGAHMDTLDGRMPGAGDDGSGSSSIMEMARVLLNSGATYKRPIYIIWYAAEERGLVGSQYVVAHFKKKNIPVRAAIQFDMTGYRVNADDPTMWVYTDHVNKKLSDFVAQLIKTYVQVPVDYSHCGYGCSDHASWDDQGVPAAFPCESNFAEHNPNIHSSEDTMDTLSLEHMANFSKLAVAFAIELASE